jgi:hypothetical protein
MSDEPLVTFDELAQKVDSYAARTDTNRPGKVERWSFAIALLVAGFGVLAGPVIGGRLGLTVTKASLFVECLSFFVFLIVLVKREWRTFGYAHRSFAQELDVDYLTYHEYVSWLGNFSDAEVGRRLRYIRDRKGMMSYRLGLFTGGLERFGILPVLIALYLQFKDWSFGDWTTFGRVNMLGGLLLWALLLVYVGGWFLIRLRTRLDVYEALLAERLNSD